MGTNPEKQFEWDCEAYLRKFRNGSVSPDDMEFIIRQCVARKQGTTFSYIVEMMTLHPYLSTVVDSLSRVTLAQYNIIFEQQLSQQQRPKEGNINCIILLLNAFQNLGKRLIEARKQDPWKEPIFTNLLGGLRTALRTKCTKSITNECSQYTSDGVSCIADITAWSLEGEIQTPFQQTVRTYCAEAIRIPITNMSDVRGGGVDRACAILQAIKKQPMEEKIREEMYAHLQLMVQRLAKDSYPGTYYESLKQAVAGTPLEETVKRPPLKEELRPVLIVRALDGVA